jgi:hypothetical protein
MSRIVFLVLFFSLFSCGRLVVDKTNIEKKKYLIINENDFVFTRKFENDNFYCKLSDIEKESYKIKFENGWQNEKRKMLKKIKYKNLNSNFKFIQQHTDYFHNKGFTDGCNLYRFLLEKKILYFIALKNKVVNIENFANDITSYFIPFSVDSNQSDYELATKLIVNPNSKENLNINKIKFIELKNKIVKDLNLLEESFVQ